ncbi:MAG: hypothetical protein AB8F34_00635 [Akkermansiaceae bacterium]
MKYITLTSILSLILFASCSDSPKKLADDQISYMEEMTELINDIADGKVSSAEGAEQIKEWGKKGDKIQERIKALREGGTSEEEFTKASKEFEKRSGKAVKAYFDAISKLQKSGRATKELQDAMMNVK